MRRLFLGVSLAALTLSSPVSADACAELKSLVDDVWADILKESPIFASSLGVDDYANEVGDYTLEGQDRQAKTAAAFLKRLDAIDMSSLSASQRVEYGILKRSLSESVEGNGYGQRVINFTNRSGWHQSFAGMSDNLPFKKASDFQSYNNRLKQYAKANDDAIAVADRGIAGKYTLPCDALAGYEKSISGLITDDVRQSRFYSPYKRSAPSGVGEAQFNEFAQQAAVTIDTIIKPALKKHEKWYIEKYKPKCAIAPGVSAQPGGAKYYDFRIRQMTTTEKTAD